MQKKTVRDTSIDLIRAIAILLVIAVHVSSTYLNKPGDVSITWWFAFILETLGKVAVPIFIMLSGHLLLDLKRQETAQAFYTKRMHRIGIPIVFWTSIYYIAYLYITHRAPDFITFITDILFLNIFYHLYFLFIVLGLYIISPYLKKVLAGSSEPEKKIFILLSLLLAAFITVSIYFTEHPLNYWSVATISIPFIGYYLAGDYLRGFEVHQRNIRQFIAIFFISLVASLILKYIGHVNSWQNVYAYTQDALSLNLIATSLSGYICLLYFTKQLTHKFSESVRHFIFSLSDASFGMYLIHPLFIYIVQKPLQNLTYFDRLPAINLVSVFLIICVFSLFSTSLLKRSKILSRVI